MSIAVTSLTSSPSAIGNLHYLAPEHNLMELFFHLAAQLRVTAKLILQLVLRTSSAGRIHHIELTDVMATCRYEFFVIIASETFQ
jgi:hypothetical protein